MMFLHIANGTGRARFNASAGREYIKHTGSNKIAYIILLPLLHRIRCIQFWRRRHASSPLSDAHCDCRSGEGRRLCLGRGTDNRRVHSCYDVTGGSLEIWCIGPQCDLGNWISMRLLLRNASSAPAAHIPWAKPLRFRLRCILGTKHGPEGSPMLTPTRPVY